MMDLSLAFAGAPIIVNRHLRPCRFDTVLWMVDRGRPLIVCAFPYMAWHLARVVVGHGDR